MDKQEYKLKAEEIKALILRREFKKAVEIADEIDWNRVRSIKMLCTVSDLYKINRRYRESKELLLMAYERYPGGRTILYSLCELCIKMGEVVQAIEYYKEYVQLAPMDTGKYVLQYKIYEAQEVSLEERIAVLEELKKREYREKWGYELAYLYHRIGLGTKCVEECDQLILWFSEGRYVKKAMELKMLHEPLSPVQQNGYKQLTGEINVADVKQEEPIPDKEEELDIQVQPMKMGKYDTINLQKALAESMKEVLDPKEAQKAASEDGSEPGQGEPKSVTSQIMAPMYDTAESPAGVQEVFFEDKETEIAVELEPEILSLPRQEKNQEAALLGETKENQEATKEIPSIKEIMKRPLVEPIQEEVPAPMAGLLAQEYDGQISLVVPEAAKVEKQITGQMNIQDVLVEWEKTKKEYEEKRKAELEQKVLAQTGRMFTDFEQKIRDGILEKLEMEAAAAREDSLKESSIADSAKEAAIPENVQDEGTAVWNGQDTSISNEAEKTKAATEIKDAAEQAAGADGLDEVLPLAEEERVRKNIEEESSGTEGQIEMEASEDSKEASGEGMENFDELEEALEEIQKNGVQEVMRELTEEEKALFGPFIQTRGGRRRFMRALDLISLAAYTGNVIIAGEAAAGTVNLAKNIMKDIQMTDANFSGVIAKVSGASLNSRNIEHTIAKLNNGGLIVEKASGMNSQAMMKLLKALNQERTGIVVILEDNKKAIKRMLAAYPAMEPFFNARIEIEELNNDALAAYGKQYAYHMGYSIDELGMLALQTQIENRQTSDHIVVVAEVRELVDEAIAHADKKNLPHLFDRLLGKRYDDEDMIILREKDFM